MGITARRANSHGRRLGPGVVLALMCLGAPALGADLTVRIEGLRSPDGEVRMGLYDESGEEKFPDKSARIGGGHTAANSKPVAYVFRALKPGTYAISMFHDENGNEKFDYTALGLPAEGYGFSNDAMGFISAPSFTAASVTLGAENKTITINVRY